MKWHWYRGGGIVATGVGLAFCVLSTSSFLDRNWLPGLAWLGAAVCVLPLMLFLWWMDERQCKREERR